MRACLRGEYRSTANVCPAREILATPDVGPVGATIATCSPLKLKAIVDVPSYTLWAIPRPSADARRTSCQFPALVTALAVSLNRLKRYLGLTAQSLVAPVES